MSEDSGEITISTTDTAPQSSPKPSVGERPIPKKWAREAARAAAALARNSEIIDSTGASGLPSNNTLRTRGFVSGPQEGERLPAQKVNQIITRRK